MRAFDSVPLLGALHRHGVAFAPILEWPELRSGSSLATFDLDICYERSRPESRTARPGAAGNCTATLRAARPICPSGSTHGRSPRDSHLQHQRRRPRLPRHASGTAGYDELARDAVDLTIAEMTSKVALET